MSELGSVAEVFVGKGQNILDWLRDAKPAVQGAISAKGATLLRGFQANSPESAQLVLSALGLELLDNAFWSTPRSNVASKTFTATEYASAREIPLHSEMSYARAFPRLVAFHSIIPAKEGGETTLANLDLVTNELEEIVEAFDSRGVTYVRTHHNGVDIPWRKAYQTDDRNEVEKIATQNNASISWVKDDVLQTRHSAQGAIKTEKGNSLYFNQSNLFHPAALPSSAATQLKALFGIDMLPRNAFFADGGPIPDHYIASINAAFSRNAVGVRWEPGDVLVIDNLRHAHGRRPFSGARQLHVALAGNHDVPRRTPINWN